MQESQVAEKLTMHWVPVLGKDGRTHLEMRWSVPTAPVAPTSRTDHPPTLHPVHAA